MYPPFIDKKYCPYIGISRTQGSQLFTIHLPNGDSYILNNDESDKYLSDLGVDPNLKILDYVQNFFRCIFHRDTEIIEWCNVDEFKVKMQDIVENYAPKIIIDVGMTA